MAYFITRLPLFLSDRSGKRLVQWDWMAKNVRKTYRYRNKILCFCLVCLCVCMPRTNTKYN